MSSIQSSTTDTETVETLGIPHISTISLISGSGGTDHEHHKFKAGRSDADHPVVRPAETSSLAGPGLATAMALGSLSTAIGGLGVGFRAAGLGYLGQSLAVLAVGIALLGCSLWCVRLRRRSALALRSANRPLRFTPTHRDLVPLTVVATNDRRVRVHAWVAEPLALPPAA